MAATRVARRKSTGTGCGRFFYLVSLPSPARDWFRAAERLLKQSGNRGTRALAALIFGFLSPKVLPGLLSVMRDFKLGTE